ncbi:MAG: hypothetical protein LBB83_07780 [Treponema sp.]|jgi:hypothetical protein|nr:hypothetical protein [Treponema sp.]
MMTGIKRLTVTMGAITLGFCLLFSGCVIYPEDEDPQKVPSSGDFPQELRAALLSSGVPSFKSPEIAGLNLNPDYSDYTSSDDTFLLSYTSAEQEDFDYYASHLVDILGDYTVDTSEPNYSCYTWMINVNTGIELGFSSQPVSTGSYSESVSYIPAYTLYLLIITN